MRISPPMRRRTFFAAGGLGLAVAAFALSAIGLAETGRGATVKEGDPAKVPLTFSGGYETDPRDGGRPVVLVAAGLGVKPEVFRKAFSGVTPARGRGPTGAEARANKAALLRTLGPLGVTNERLDEVSDYYRYRPQDGELWPVRPAAGYAVVEAGKVKRIVITEPGSGYSAPPRVSAKGLAGVKLKASLRFGKDLESNGSITAVELLPPKPDEPSR